jgi:hypothetical protein
VDKLKPFIHLKEGDGRAKDDLYKMTRLFTALCLISDSYGTFDRDISCFEPQRHSRDGISSKH